MALKETEEELEEAYARMTGKGDRMETALLWHLFLAQDGGDAMNQLWDYHPDSWLDSIENSWKGDSCVKLLNKCAGTYFHISKQLDKDGNMILVAEEQTTDVGW